MQKQESKEGQQLGDYSRNPSEKDAGGLSQWGGVGVWLEFKAKTRIANG